MKHDDCKAPLLRRTNMEGEGRTDIQRLRTPRQSSEWRSTSFIFFVALIASLFVMKTIGSDPVDTSVPAHFQHASMKALESQNDDTESATVVHVNLTASDLYNVTSVRDWLFTKGVTSLEGDIDQYLPAEIKIKFDLTGVAMNIGDDALKGWIVFGLFNGRKLASYVIVMTITGELQAIYPTLQDNQNAHPDALKLRSPEHIIFMENLCGGCSSHARAKEWAWKSDSIRAIGGVANGFMDCHDMQWVAPNAKSGDNSDAFWVPWQPDRNVGRGSGALLVNATSGKYLENFTLPLYLNGVELCEDVNHVQLLNDDTMAFLSCRESNAQVMYNRLSGSIEWILDGPNGYFDFYNLAGELISKGGNTYFHGQHNAEYFGDGQVFLFDNAYEQMTQSQLCEVQLDFDKFTATVTWAYKMPLDYPYGYTPIYGDADRLPTGNVLSSFWPGTQKQEDYDLKVFEVEPVSGDIAWSMEIYRKAYRENRKNAQGEWGSTTGWLSYSSERFYQAPLIWDLVCNKTTDTKDGFVNVSFYTVNSIKQNNFAQGFYKLVDLGDKVLVANSISFEPHWMATQIHIGYQGLPPHLLKVSNEWNQVTEKTVDCVYLHDS